jgi:hypothetical protein
VAVDMRRHTALTAARTANPERFASTPAPKILNLPDAAWINLPAKDPPTREPAPQNVPVQLVLASPTLKIPKSATAARS